MVTVSNLTTYLDKLLLSSPIKDYAPNGLQVQGKTEIQHVVTGVSANLALIEAAIQKNADAILVHHGLFWNGEPYPLVGIKVHRIKALLQAEINLLAYHLPLDIHPKYGNNVQFAKKLNLSIKGTFPQSDPTPLGLWGELPTPCPAHEFALQLHHALGQLPLHIKTHSRPIRSVAWCTGAAHDLIVQAAELGVDAFVSGEIAERTPALAQELGIDYFAAGHHATEKDGVRSLGEHLAQYFDLQVDFIDIANTI